MEFEELYKEELDELRLTMKLTVKSLEYLYEELQKSNLPDEVKKTILANFKIQGDK